MIRPVRILSNTRWFDGRSIRGHPVEALHLEGSGPGAAWRWFREAHRCDAVVFNVEAGPLLMFCAFVRLFGLKRAKVVGVDLILERASGWKGTLRFLIKRFLLRSVDLFIWYYRRTGDVRRLYDIAARKTAYVPFKVNSLDAVLAAQPKDEGFVLSCGRSRRDYRTFCAAMAGLDTPAVILAHIGRETEEHGASIDVNAIPPNVRIVDDDGSAASWIDWMSRARTVVLPIVPETLAPSGIGAYLGAMALGKCVVITESPATWDILSPNEAVLVPPRDVEAMRSAIRRVVTDAPYRERIAATGRRYALSLGDESQLAVNIAEEVGRLLGLPPLPAGHEEPAQRVGGSGATS
jgi:glycosyltransferase involved in cell wall biosynthesis